MSGRNGQDALAPPRTAKVVIRVGVAVGGRQEVAVARFKDTRPAPKAAPRRVQPPLDRKGLASGDEQDTPCRTVKLLGGQISDDPGIASGIPDDLSKS